MSIPYQDTEVRVEKSQEDIRKILRKYEADEIQFFESYSPKRLIKVRFFKSVKGQRYGICFKVPLPEPERKMRNGQFRSPSQMEKARAKYERGAWRALHWALKSRMEAIAMGIESFEEAFLSHFEIPGTDRQIGETIIPGLETNNLGFLAIALEEDPHKLLEIREGATAEEIKKAFRELSRRHHPDAGGDAAYFSRIVSARDRLLKEARK